MTIRRRPSTLSEAYRFALGDTRAARDMVLRSRGRVVAVVIVLALLGVAAFLVVRWAGWA